MTTLLGRTYRFESAHRLPMLPATHKCHHLHGHNYKVVVTVRGPLDARGFVMDFAEMDAAVMPLVKTVDHKVLNDIPGLENPTAEVIAAWFLERVKGAAGVRVYENEDCWAEVSV
jgi:6-pyruvoyltetrahydropterin/6-carboxytetrahydropterin synthase